MINLLSDMMQNIEFIKYVNIFLTILSLVYYLQIKPYNKSSVKLKKKSLHTLNSVVTTPDFFP